MRQASFCSCSSASRKSLSAQPDGRKKRNRSRTDKQQSDIRRKSQKASCFMLYAQFRLSAPQASVKYLVVLRALCPPAAACTDACKAHGPQDVQIHLLFHPRQLQFRPFRQITWTIDRPVPCLSVMHTDRRTARAVLPTITMAGSLNPALSNRSHGRWTGLCLHSLPGSSGNEKGIRATRIPDKLHSGSERIWLIWPLQCSVRLRCGRM